MVTNKKVLVKSRIMVLINLLHNLLHALLKLGCGPFCGVKNFFIVELNYYIEEGTPR
jgi:hypothetical protein